MHGGPGPVIYGTTTRTGQGPYPALPDNECKNSDHLGGRRGPTAGVGPESGAFSSICYVFECFKIVSTFDRYLAVPFGHWIWWWTFTFQFYFSSSGFPGYFKTEDKKIRRTLVHQCEHFVGTRPTKIAHKFFQILEKILCPKKSKNIFPILGQKTMQIDVIWSQGYVKIVFLTKNQFYNFLIFGLRKISKIFEKFVKFFSNFFSNFSIFYTFFANFYKFHQLLTHLELYRTLQNMSSVIGWGDKRFQKSTKIQLFWTNFLGKLFFESFLDILTLTIKNVFFDARHFFPW